MARVVFLMDRLVRPFGLSGKSVVPLMSSVACAIPGVMATRTISTFKDRIVTIMVAPLMSCSARIPVFTLLIALVIPEQRVGGVFDLQGLVLLALYALGFGKEQSWHGFRASARTMLVDELNLDHLAIEANLAHAVKDSNGRSYNRTHYLKQRFEQIQQWADYLDKLARGADVIQFKAA